VDESQKCDGKTVTTSSFLMVYAILINACVYIVQYMQNSFEKLELF